MDKLFLEKEIEDFYMSCSIPDSIYHTYMTLGLPEPVKRYFGYALREGQPYLRHPRALLDGRFQLKNSWVNMKSQAYFSGGCPGFVLHSVLGPSSYNVTASDIYTNGRGRLKVKLLAAITLVESDGEANGIDCLVKWLSFSPLFPTSILPDENKCWEYIDDTSARIYCSHGGTAVSGIFNFNEMGQITGFAQEKNSAKGDSGQTSVYSDYRRVNGIGLPTRLDMRLCFGNIGKREAAFKIERIDFNMPKAYR